jgi:hypothetical protein
MKFDLKTVTVLSLPILFLSACASTPEPVEIVEVEVPVIEQTCYPIASLEKVVVPAVTKTMYSSVIIESAQEYYTDPETGERVEITAPPIEEVQPHIVVVKEEEIYYQTPEGEMVIDICEVNDSTVKSLPVEPVVEPAPAE